jgi:hypothetical protein
MIMHDIQNFDVKAVSKNISTADYPQHIQLAHILLTQTGTYLAYTKVFTNRVGGVA